MKYPPQPLAGSARSRGSRTLATLAMLAFALLLTGCASTPAVQAPPADLFADSRFQRPADLLAADDIFALTPAMRAYAADVMQHRRGREVRRALFDALYQRDQLQLEYDSTMTRTAAQAFEARQGNCLSLVIMTAALANEMNIPVVFQSVRTDDTWSRSGEIYFNSGHVNLKLGRAVRDSINGYDSEHFTVIDFQPLPEGKRIDGSAIGRDTVVAMFMNNRAAEALARGRYDDAYWWARNAILADPTLLYPYNTLAVVYRRHGDLEHAERTLRFALRHEPDSTIALSNLAQLLEVSDRRDEARPIRDKLARLQPVTPFYYFNLGKMAMEMGDYRRARILFERELQRDPYYHEFHAWLAIAKLHLGDVAGANEHVKKAMVTSTTRDDYALYAAKLDKLRAAQSTHH